MRQTVASVTFFCLKLAMATALVCGVSSAYAVDLLEVYRLAVKNDPVYLGAGSANRAAQEQTPLARAQLLPELSLSASTDFNHQKTRRSGTFGDTGTNRFTANTFTLSLSQPIYRKDLLIGLSQADTQVRQSNVEFAFALQDLMLRVSEAYFDVLAALDDLEFLRSERDANEQQLRQSQQRFEVGLIAITDVEEAKAGFDLSNAQVIEAEIEVDNSWEALREITGLYLDLTTLKPLVADTPLITPVPNDVDAWTGTALQQNLQLSAALLASEIAHTEIRRQEAQHLPTLDLVASHGLDQSGGRFGNTDIVTSSIGLQLNLPIFQGSMHHHHAMAARAQTRAAEAEFEVTRQQVFLQIQQLFIDARAHGEEAALYKTAIIPQAEQALVSAMAGYQVDKVDFLTLLDNQVTLFDFEIAYHHHLTEYEKSLARLEAVVGKRLF